MVGREEPQQVLLSLSAFAEAIVFEDLQQALRKVVNVISPRRRLVILSDWAIRRSSLLHGVVYTPRLESPSGSEDSLGAEFNVNSQNFSCCHVTIVSSASVDLRNENKADADVVREHLACEHLLASKVKDRLIIRLAHICGADGDGEEFELKDGVWCWRGTTKPVYPMITADFLVSTMVRLILEKKTGLVRAGYHV